MSKSTNAATSTPAVSSAAAEIDHRLEAASARMALENELLSRRNTTLQQQNAALREHLERRRAFAARLEQIADDLRREQSMMDAETARLLSSEEETAVFARAV